MSRAPAARLSTSVLVAYAVPAVGTTASMVLMSLYYLKFATDVLLLAPGVVGGLLFASRFWDAVSDPLAGYLSDRTRARLGRRRVWMVAGAPALGLALVMLWAPPAALEGRALVLWVGLSLLLFYTAYTAFSVPYGALGAELSQDYHERNRLFAVRQVVGAAGMGFALAAFYLLLESAQDGAGRGPRAMALGVGLFAGLLVAGTGLYAVARVPERPEYQGRGGLRLFGAVKDVGRNPHARRLMFVEAMHHFSIASLSLLGAYLFQYILHAPSWMAAIFIASFAVGVGLSIPVWLRLAGRFGKHRCWQASLWALGFVYSSFYVALGDWGIADDVPAIALACTVSALIGAISACGWFIGKSIEADVIDWDEHETGERKEGAYIAAWSFIEKSAGAVAAGLLGFVLELSGYQPGVEQSGSTQTAILVLISLVPGAGHFAAAWVFRGFVLGEPEHARIRAALDAQR